MRVIVTLNDQEINRPDNLEELSIELNFDKDDPRAQVSTNEWELGVGDRRKNNDGAIIANKHISDGLNNGVGITEGAAFQIKIQHKGVEHIPFDGFLDLRTALISCNKVIAPAMETGGIDWANEAFDGVSIEQIYNEGVYLTSANNIPVPYIISTIPDAQSTIIAALGTFVLLNEVKNQVQMLLEYLPHGANPFTASIIVSIVLRVAHIIVLLVAIINFVIQLFNCIIQPVKYHMGMYLVDQLRAGCKRFGLEFKSSIFDSFPFNKIVIIPEKFNQNVNEDKDGILGFTKPNVNEQVGYYKGSFGDLLRVAKLLIKGKIILRGDGYLHLENEAFKTGAPKYKLPPVEIIEHTTNAAEIVTNYLLQFTVDTNDKNTMQKYPGTRMQAITEQKVTNDVKKRLLSGIETVTLPFALTNTKTELTFPEKVFDQFFKAIEPVVSSLVDVVNEIIDVINKLIKTLNKIIKALGVIGIEIDWEIREITPIQTPNFSNLIENRIGMILLENDFINVPKILILNSNSNPANNKPLAQSREVLNALYLWNNFHYVVSFVPREGNENGNQYLNYTTPSIPFTFNDYTLVKNSDGQIEDAHGNEAKIYSLTWNVEELTAIIKFGINTKYTNNLKETILEPNGQ